LGYIDDEKDNSVCLDDGDCDGIADNDDNCPSTPNGSSLGTCINCSNGTTGGACKKREDCKTGYLCGMNQENICGNDLDNDGIINNEDNCICVDNPMQADTHPVGGNNCGDACDCIGNLDKDGEVGIRDISLFNNNLGRKNCTQQNPCNGDFDCDRDVDDDDYLILKKNIGRVNCAACEFKCSY
jgi:syndecan 4